MTWLKHTSLCRKSRRLQLSHNTLITILGVDLNKFPNQPQPIIIPQTTLAYCKHL